MVSESKKQVAWKYTIHSLGGLTITTGTMPTLPISALQLPDDLDAPGLEAASFAISLARIGDEGSGYHTRNDPNPSRQYQRITITERRGAVEIRCKAREVVHGFLAPGRDNATLLVYDFSFNAAKTGRRIISANISFRFSSMRPNSPIPKVHGLAPFGHFIILPTSREESSTIGAEVNTSGGFFGASIGGVVKWEKTTSGTTCDATTLNGATECDDFGNEIGVNWIIHENKTTKTGIPSFLRVAFLLSREDNEEFQGYFEAKLETDWKTEMSRFFGAKSRDDPILFDPQRDPTNNLCPAGYDLENLAEVDLKSISDISFHAAMPNK
ncbi:hypothetical protein O1611_g1821 [Lasiodiplodia mahajangana]|uniref:Uncharacterized protein n=1 Tax=Lasiodiplodia mahajangana TaxID=1108764 RepID=A0ACC2JWY5_9PEZI|nr:hypothetical protein O1611_g1821 [Lasiodiplodia mahajangana]